MNDSVDEARSRFEKLKQYLEQDPQNLALRQDAARIGIRARAFDEVITVCAGSNDDRELAYHRGTALLALRQWESAVAVFRQLLNSDPANAAFRFNLTYALSESSHHQEALAVIQEGGDQFFGDVPDARRIAGISAYRLGEVSAARAHLEQYVQDRPQDISALGLSSLIRFDDGDTPAAKTALEQALAQDPEQPLALLTKGSIALEQLDKGVATQAFDKILEKNPQQGRAWSGKAFALLLDRDFEGAESAFLKAVELMPDHIGTWHGLAWIQIIKGDLDAAEASLMKALELDRNFGETHGSLAVVAALRGQADESERMAKRAARLNPAGFSGRYARALVQTRSGEEKKGQEAIAKLLASTMPSGNASVQELVQSLFGGRKSN